MKVILDFDGSMEDFKNAIMASDKTLDFYDSLFWEMDYGGKSSKHRTRYGDITITVRESE